jgi:hypothetical protein
MYSRIASIANALTISVLFFSCSGKDEPDTEMDEVMQRTFSFSGHEWIAEGTGSVRVNPGQNYFSCSEENVWVDKEGNLHLKITERNGNWYCSRVTLKESYGFGKYVFHVSSRVDKLDRNVVGGLFAYLDDSNEIDIEFSRWGKIFNKNSQFAVQPAHHDGNIFRYKNKLRGESSTHIIDWEKDHIDFASYRGYHTIRPPERMVINEWSYAGVNIPPGGEEKIMINLWLFQGKPPSDRKEAEIIVKSFGIY